MSDATNMPVMKLKMSNFLNPNGHPKLEIHFNPASANESARIQVIRERADRHGVMTQISHTPGRGYKLILIGPREDIKSSLNAKHNTRTRRRTSSGSRRRSSSGSRRATTRRHNRS